MTPPPGARLVTSPGCAVEPLVHAPEAVQSARIRGVRVVDNAVLQHERAHAWSLARVGGRIGSGRGRHLGHGRLAAAQLPRSLTPVVVFDAALALLRLREPHAEIRVEVATERGCPR